MPSASGARTRRELEEEQLRLHHSPGGGLRAIRERNGVSYDEPDPKPTRARPEPRPAVPPILRKPTLTEMCEAAERDFPAAAEAAQNLDRLRDEAVQRTRERLAAEVRVAAPPAGLEPAERAPGQTTSIGGYAPIWTWAVATGRRASRAECRGRPPREFVEAYAMAVRAGWVPPDATPAPRPVKHPIRSVAVRLSDAEFANVRANAAGRGVPLGEVVRELLDAGGCLAPPG
jgi:hypothetical protein